MGNREKAKIFIYNFDQFEWNQCYIFKTLTIDQIINKKYIVTKISSYFLLHSTGSRKKFVKIYSKWKRNEKAVNLLLFDFDVSFAMKSLYNVDYFHECGEVILSHNKILRVVSKYPNVNNGHVRSQNPFFKSYTGLHDNMPHS